MLLALCISIAAAVPAPAYTEVARLRLYSAFWPKTLLHESSHQWDNEIDARLSAIAKAQGKALDPQLSHALIFYTSGEIVTELAPGHEPYTVKNGLWNRSGLAPFKPLLDQYWRPYIRGAGTFEQAAAKLVEARQ